jgi:hypothetical protein
MKDSSICIFFEPTFSFSRKHPLGRLKKQPREPLASPPRRVTERNPKPPPPFVDRALPRHYPSGPQISREVARKAAAWTSSSSHAGRGGRDRSALSARLVGSGCPPAVAGGVASRSGGALAGSRVCTERALRLLMGWLLLEWQWRGLTTADVAGAAL